MFEILSDSSIPPDELLPDTGLGLEIERAVSPIFVKTPLYGTRSSTVVLLDYNGNVTFTENSFRPDGRLPFRSGGSDSGMDCRNRILFDYPY